MLINELMPQVREYFIKEMTALINKYNRITQYNNEEIQIVLKVLDKMDLLEERGLDVERLTELSELMKQNT